MQVQHLLTYSWLALAFHSQDKKIENRSFHSRKKDSIWMPGLFVASNARQVNISLLTDNVWSKKIRNKNKTKQKIKHIEWRKCWVRSWYCKAETLRHICVVPKGKLQLSQPHHSIVGLFFYCRTQFLSSNLSSTVLQNEASFGAAAKSYEDPGQHLTFASAHQRGSTQQTALVQQP